MCDLQTWKENDLQLSGEDLQLPNNDKTGLPREVLQVDGAALIPAAPCPYY
jgi:hypothetical protein